LKRVVYRRCGVKKLFLNLLAILIVSFDISADCVPSGALYSQEDSGSSCTSVWKREGRRVTFPDLYAENIIVTGSGVCTHTQDYCCAPYYYESKCWPLFFDLSQRMDFGDRMFTPVFLL
jgi:hypothetical protein